jgi:hypothetical protein
MRIRLVAMSWLDVAVVMGILLGTQGACAVSQTQGESDGAQPAIDAQFARDLSAQDATDVSTSSTQPCTDVSPDDRESCERSTCVLAGYPDPVPLRLSVVADSGGPSFAEIRVRSGPCTAEPCPTDCRSLYVYPDGSQVADTATCELEAIATDGRREEFSLRMQRKQQVSHWICVRGVRYGMWIESKSPDIELSPSAKVVRFWGEGGGVGARDASLTDDSGGRDSGAD